MPSINLSSFFQINQTLKLRKLYLKLVTVKKSSLCSFVDNLRSIEAICLMLAASLPKLSFSPIFAFKKEKTMFLKFFNNRA